jgi:predicted neuraminidase
VNRLCQAIPGIVLLTVAVLLSSCGTPTGTEPAFNRIISPASRERPRQSEGDIVVLKDHSLLAAWSDFSSRADHALGRISAARSFDGGHTWGRPFVLVENEGRLNVMSVSFVRVNAREILLFYLVKNSLKDLKVVVRRSSDEAQTWSRPVVVTPDGGYHIMNNARVIQLASGRLLCPVSFCDDMAIRDAHLRSITYFSDDEGHSWYRGKGVVDCANRGAMEPGLIELKDHHVLQIIRTDRGQIYSSISMDAGNTWGEAVPTGVSSPESPATISRLPYAPRELMLVYNPSTNAGIHSVAARTPLVCSLSGDEGRTWSPPRALESDTNFSYAYTSVKWHEMRALLTYYYAPYPGDQISLKFQSIPLNWFYEIR